MKSRPGPPTTYYLPSLDGLRCFSILFVIVAHLSVHNPGMLGEGLSPLFASGLFGVHVFFVISGFIITTLLLNEQERTGSISLGRFYLRRVLRILPLAYSFLLVLLLLNTFCHLAIRSLSFATAFSFLKNIGGLPGDWYTEHYWSLSVEEQYYLLFPFLLSRGLKLYLTVCLTFIAIYFGKNILEHFWVSPYQGGIEPVWDVVFSSYMLTILVGSLTAILFVRGRKWLNAFPIDRRVLAPLQIGAFMLAPYLLAHPFLVGFSTFLSSLLIAFALLLLVCFPHGPVYRILNLRPVAFIGRLSFSLYIWQQLFTAHQPWADWFTFGNSVFLNLVGLAAVALISYYGIERPFLLLKSRLQVQRKQRQLQPA